MARTKRSTPEVPIAPAPALESLDDVEVYEPDPVERTRPVRGRGGIQRRLTASLPGAIAGTFLVCAIAFGASLQASSGPAGSRSDDGAAAAAEGVGSGTDGTLSERGADAPDQAVDGDRPGVVVAPDQTIDGDPPIDGDAPTTEPTPVPDATSVGLDVALGDGGAVRLDWDSCPVDGVTAWKVIRSTVGAATYPRGEGDSLVGVVDPGKTAFVDASAPAGRKLWYAVFAVTDAGEARLVACASSARSIETPAEKPTEPKPTDKPAMGLSVAVREGAIFIDWTGCEVDGAELYKVVRSSNEGVSWPLGAGDTLVAVVEVGGRTAAWDEHAPAGKKAWYRVFCVRHAGDGYKVLNATPPRGVTAPSVPAPEPKAMWIEVGLDAGAVVVNWEACGGEQFSHYRILRRIGDSTTVVREIENAATTTWVDTTVEPGGTYEYLVQSKGLIGGSYVLLGSTGWAAVTVE